MKRNEPHNISQLLLKTTTAPINISANKPHVRSDYHLVKDLLLILMTINPCFRSIALLLGLYQSMSKMTVDDEKYKLVEIYSLDIILEKIAKMCNVCGRTVAYCLWKSTTIPWLWKYCLDCQDDSLSGMTFGLGLLSEE